MVGQKCLRLENPGTSCFVNSNINALFSIPSFISFLTGRSVTSCLKAGRGALYFELRRLAKWQGSRPASSDMVRQLVSSTFPAGGFESGQHDAAEFLIALIDALKDEFDLSLAILGQNQQPLPPLHPPTNGLVHGVV